jgi:hypothetical protein
MVLMRRRWVGAILGLYLIMRVAYGGDDPIVVDVFSSLLGLLSVALVAISDARCVQAKRGMGKWLMAIYRLHLRSKSA